MVRVTITWMVLLVLPAVTVTEPVLVPGVNAVAFTETVMELVPFAAAGFGAADAESHGEPGLIPSKNERGLAVLLVSVAVWDGGETAELTAKVREPGPRENGSIGAVTVSDTVTANAAHGEPPPLQFRVTKPT